MDSPLQKLAPIPLTANELVPHPRPERRRGRFELAKRDPASDSPHGEPAETPANDLPVSPHDADEAGSRLDLTA